MEEKRKYEDVPTTELLDFIAKKLPYDNEKEWRKQQDFSKELEERDPFMHLKNKCDNMQKKIRELETAVEKLLKHTHDQAGRPVVNINEAVELGMRLF